VGKSLLVAALSLVLAGLGHLAIGLPRGFWFAVPSGILLYLHFTGQWEFADVAFLGLGIFSAFDAFSFAQRGHGII
jgi:hypothetical protein